MARGNEENLLRPEDLTSEQLRERARKGGLASAKARKEKKTLKMELEALLEVMDKNGDSVQKKMSFALIKKAVNGDTKAFEIIRDTIGQKPRENLNIDFERTQEEAKELLANMKDMMNNDNKS